MGAVGGVRSFAGGPLRSFDSTGSKRVYVSYEHVAPPRIQVVNMQEVADLGGSHQRVYEMGRWDSFPSCTWVDRFVLKRRRCRGSNPGVPCLVGGKDTQANLFQFAGQTQPYGAAVR
jgi:hypothetical protein